VFNKKILLYPKRRLYPKGAANGLSITKHHYIIITSADTRYWRAEA
jgi:hypothetical protein